MDMFMSLIVTIMAEIVSYYICKWPDSDNHRKPPFHNGIENPTRKQLVGFSFII